MQSSREPVLRYHAKVHSLSNSNSQESQCSLSHLSQASSQVDLSSDDGSTARSAQEYSERSIYLTHTAGRALYGRRGRAHTNATYTGPAVAAAEIRVA